MENFLQMNVRWRKFLSCFLLIFLFNSLLSQEQTPFNDYWKVGVVGTYAKHQSFNEENSLDFKLQNMNVPSFGIKYNFYQFRDFNLSASLQHYKFARNHKFRLLAQDSPANHDLYFHDTYRVSDMDHLTLNIAIEKYFPWKANYFIIGLGPEIRLLRSFQSHAGTGYRSSDESVTILEIYTDTEKELNFGIRADTGIGLPSRLGLFELRLHGHLGFSKFVEGTVIVSNLLVSPSSTTHFSTSGHYVGFSLSYFPKRKNKKL